MRKWKKFLSLRSDKKKLLLEALLYLGWARILKALPFSRVAPMLGEPMTETSYDRNLANERIALQISQAIRVASKHTWWESKCLVSAIAGMKMLQRRRIGSTLYMGTARDPSGKLVAHAWLRSGGLILTGAGGLEQYTVVAKFGQRMPETKGIST